ncbi:MAG: class I SAM-dependent methyltransferase [Patescibacteria group bacterium]|mgnify:CR=1 FL=1
MEKHYSEISSTWRNFEQISSELELSNEDIKEKLILDLGIGGAGFAEGIKKHQELSFRVVSLDPNYNLKTLTEENGDLMKDAIKEIKEQKLEAVAGLSESLPFKDEAFDLVISNHAVPWHIAEDTEKVVRSIVEIIRVLKPGGEARLHPVEEKTAQVIESAINENCSIESRKGIIIIRKNLPPKKN